MKHDASNIVPLYRTNPKFLLLQIIDTTLHIYQKDTKMKIYINIYLKKTPEQVTQLYLLEIILKVKNRSFRPAFNTI